MADILIFIIIGGISGFFSGYLGIGGGVILLPLLTYFIDMPINEAVYLSMLFVISASASGIIIHRRFCNINIKVGVVMGFSSIISSFVIAFYSLSVSDSVLKLFFTCES